MKCLNKIIIVLIILLFNSFFSSAQVAAYFYADKTIGCSPLDVSFENGSIGATSYRWDFGDGASSSSNGPRHIFGTPGLYTVKLIAYNGTNKDSSQLTIKVVDKPKAIFTVNDSVGCLPLIVNFKDESTDVNPIVKWEWTFGDGGASTLKSPSHIYSAVPSSYNVSLTVTNSNGCINIISKFIVVKDCNRVWPGDANHDKIANSFDLLSIGLNYGLNGYKRDSVSILWEEKRSSNWSSPELNGVNSKHSDCNGDGKVDAEDVKAIVENYGLTYNKTDEIQHASENYPKLFFIVPNKNAVIGEKFIAEVWAGEKDNMVKNLYGLGLRINFNTSIAEEGTMKFEFSDSWIGDLGFNAISMDTCFQNKGLIEASIIRTDKRNKSGFGKIGEIQFISKATTSATDFDMSFSTYEGVDSAGAKKSFAVNLVTIGVNDLISESTSSLKIYPNPSNGIVFIEGSDDGDALVSVQDLMGKIVYSRNQAFIKSESKIEINNLAPGIYIVKVNSAKKVMTGRLTIK